MSVGRSAHKADGGVRVQSILEHSWVWKDSDGWIVWERREDTKKKKSYSIIRESIKMTQRSHVVLCPEVVNQNSQGADVELVLWHQGILQVQIFLILRLCYFFGF